MKTKLDRGEISFPSPKSHVMEALDRVIDTTLFAHWTTSFRRIDLYAADYASGTLVLASENVLNNVALCDMAQSFLEKYNLQFQEDEDVYALRSLFN